MTDAVTLDADAVLAQLSTPVVVLVAGSGDIVYENAAARRLSFAYRETPGWRVIDAHGRPVPGASLPHIEARRGRRFDRRLLHFANGDRSYALRFHCHSIDGDSDRCVLTFEDVTSLDETQRQLREALRARDELVSMAAHELRSPLGALQLIVERLLRKAADIAPSEIKRLAESGIRQTRRLTVLIGNLLDVSRIRAGQFALDREHIKLGEVISETCEALAEQALTAGTSLSVRIDDPARGLWDRSRMEQVVVNLVTNAIKYGAGSPIEVRLHRLDDEQVELCVHDGGPGIPDAEHGRIFDAFERASERHTSQSLGLGLFIVREIVRAHGGTIALRSVPGATTFAITLPVGEPS